MWAQVFPRQRRALRRCVFGVKCDSSLNGVGAEAPPSVGDENRLGWLAASFVEPGRDDGSDGLG
jgi:hypothetical protein